MKHNQLIIILFPILFANCGSNAQSSSGARWNPVLFDAGPSAKIKEIHLLNDSQYLAHVENGTNSVMQSLDRGITWKPFKLHDDINSENFCMDAYKNLAVFASEGMVFIYEHPTGNWREISTFKPRLITAIKIGTSQTLFLGFASEPAYPFVTSSYRLADDKEFTSGSEIKRPEGIFMLYRDPAGFIYAGTRESGIWKNEGVWYNMHDRTRTKKPDS